MVKACLALHCTHYASTVFGYLDREPTRLIISASGVCLYAFGSNGLEEFRVLCIFSAVAIAARPLYLIGLIAGKIITLFITI